MTATSLGPMVLLTTDDPERCAQAVMHVVTSELPQEATVYVLTHGPDAEPIQAVAMQAASVNPEVNVQVASATGATRLQAINAAVVGLPQGRDVVFLADDALVCRGWLQGLLSCLEPTEVHGLGERTLKRRRRIGLVGGCSNQSPTESQRLELTEGESDLGLQSYAAARLDHFSGAVSVADWLDGFCLLATAEVIGGATQDGQRPLLDAGCGPWAWADLCLRASDVGLASVVSEAVYVGRSVQTPLMIHSHGDVRHRLRFYAQHPAKESHKTVAVVRAPFRWWQDVQLLRACLSRVAEVVDAVVLVVLGNPLAVQGDLETPRKPSALDQRLLKACAEADAATVGMEVGAWASTVVKDKQVVAEVYQGEGGQGDHYNVGLELAERLSADAVLMLNHDELIERGVTREGLQRILQHPNPLVRCFDAGLAYHHDSPTLVRVDAPYGHGGTYRGGSHAGRLYRLRDGVRPVVEDASVTTTVPDHGLAAQRVAALRLRRLGLLRLPDRDRLGVAETGEGFRVSQWTDVARLGLHMLVYENEDPDDVARWFDTLHALADALVLVWTGDWAEGDKVWTTNLDLLAGDDWYSTGPSRALAAVAQLHGAVWVHQPLEDNLGQARNAGIHALHDRGGLEWAMFVDPDEWLEEPLHDVMSLRNMMESSRWGWLIQAANYRPDQDVPTISDSVRISRLDADRRMVMNGRVHEGFTKALQGLQDDGVHPRLVYAPFMLQHRGLAKDDRIMAQKLDKYEHLLRLQLEDDPHDPGAWVSLGWHYLNDGHTDLGVECYERAVTCAGRSYLPFKEMGMHHLRIAKAMFDQCEDRLTSAHQFHKLLQTMREWLSKYAPPHPIVGRPDEREPAALPDWTPPSDSDDVE